MFKMSETSLLNPHFPKWKNDSGCMMYCIKLFCRNRDMVSIDDEIGDTFRRFASRFDGLTSSSIDLPHPS